MKTTDKMLKELQKKVSSYGYYYNDICTPSKIDNALNCKDDLYDFFTIQQLVDINNFLADEINNKPHTENEKQALKHELTEIQKIINKRFEKL